MDIEGNIKNFLSGKPLPFSNWRKPIIASWIDRPSMAHCVKVLDKKVGHLLAKGARGKLRQWLLSDDRDFNNITAERYVMDYLRLKNPNLKENIFDTGTSSVDGTLHAEGREIGVEITALNSSISDWIFSERLILLLNELGFYPEYNLTVSYDWEHIREEMKRNAIYTYIEKLGNAIVSSDTMLLHDLGVTCGQSRLKTSEIAWDCGNADTFPILKQITKDLISKLSESKKKQLSIFKENIVFVVVNHLPLNWMNPDIFMRDTCDSNIQKEIEGLLPQNVIGICYYNYSLSQETPYYPLKIFWRNGHARLSINL